MYGNANKSSFKRNSFNLEADGLSVSVGAVADGVDDESVVGFFSEADSVVSDAKAEFFGVTLQLLNGSLAGLGETMEGSENPHGMYAVDAADIGASR